FADSGSPGQPREQLIDRHANRDWPDHVFFRVFGSRVKIVKGGRQAALYAQAALRAVSMRRFGVMSPTSLVENSNPRPASPPHPPKRNSPLKKTFVSAIEAWLKSSSVSALSPPIVTDPPWTMAAIQVNAGTSLTAPSDEARRACLPKSRSRSD